MFLNNLIYLNITIVMYNTLLKYFDCSLVMEKYQKLENENIHEVGFEPITLNVVVFIEIKCDVLNLN